MQQLRARAAVEDSEEPSASAVGHPNATAHVVPVAGAAPPQPRESTALNQDSAVEVAERDGDAAKKKKVRL
jgi:hypothetical protein